MLMNDPVKRIPICEIRKDPWFGFNCPPYLSMPWEEYASKHEWVFGYLFQSERSKSILPSSSVNS